MNRKRKHHYLPISYLNGFCSVDKKVWTYKKKSFKSPHANSPSSTAHVRGLYYMIGDEIDVNRIEDYFASDIEGPAAEPLKKLISKGLISEDEKYKLSLFFAALVVRSPHFIQQLDDMFSDLIREVVIQDASNRELFHNKYQRLYGDMTETEFEEYRLLIFGQRNVKIRMNRNYSVIYVLKLISILAKILYALKWCLFETDDVNPFITSDNLASCMNLDIGTYRTNQASETENDCYSYIPLSSKICLQFHMDGRLNEYEVISVNEHNCAIFSKINQRTFLESHKYVFACADSEILKRSFEDILP